MPVERRPLRAPPLLEHAIRILRADAGAVVGHLDLDPVRVRDDPDAHHRVHRLPLEDCVHSVVDEVADDGAEVSGGIVVESREV